MTRGAAKKGFDMQMAASYQVWGALLIPVMVPLLVAGGGWLYGRDIWVPPMQLLALIARQQFLPLLAGVGLVWMAPAFSARVQRVLTPVGNVLIIVILVVILYKDGSCASEGESVGSAGRAVARRGVSDGGAPARGPVRGGADAVHLQRAPERGSRVVTGRPST